MERMSVLQVGMANVIQLMPGGIWKNAKNRSNFLLNNIARMAYFHPFTSFLFSQNSQPAQTSLHLYPAVFFPETKKKSFSH